MSMTCTEYTSSFLFFFLVIRPPPTSTLFPYTTLFRSSCASAARPGLPSGRDHPEPTARAGRSEEHTSELQSRGNVVCRLLLEKKKKQQHGRRGRADNRWEHRHLETVNAE